MKRLTLCMTLAAAMTFALTAEAITVDELISKMNEKYAGVDTIVAEQSMEGAVSQQGMNIELSGSGTLKTKYKEDETLVIFEQDQTMTMPMMGDMEMTQTMAYDGEEALVLVETMGQTQAIRIGQAQLQDISAKPGEDLKKLEEQGYALTVTEGEAEGTPVYVLKADAPMENLPNITSYIAMDSLAPVKQVVDGPGQTHMETTYSSFATNKPLDDAIFELTVPEGVMIMDADEMGGMFGGGMGGGGQQGGAPEGS